MNHCVVLYLRRAAPNGLSTAPQIYAVERSGGHFSCRLGLGGFVMMVPSRICCPRG